MRSPCRSLLFLAVFLGGRAVGWAVPGLLTSVQELAPNPPGAEVIVNAGLNTGALIWQDRAFTYAGVPVFLQGADYIQMTENTKNASNFQLQVDFSQNATFYLMIIDNVNVSGTMAWVSSLGFSNTGQTIVLESNTHNIYAGTFSAGSITLGALGPYPGSGGYSMYTVAAVTAIPEPSAYAMLASLAALGLVVAARRRAS